MLTLKKNLIILIISIIFFCSSILIIYILIYKKDSNSICDINAKVTKVYDGDTVQAGGYKIRLIGMDAPENIYEGSEIKDYKYYGCPELANNFAKEKLLNKKIKFCQDRQGQEHDKYDRKLRYAMVPESENMSNKLKPLSYFAIKNGYAKRYAYATYTWKKKFKDLETKAKEKKIGIWSNICQTQDLEVKKKYNKCGLLEENDLCMIKGNVSDKGKYYYNIGDNNYSNVKIDINKGERWFCNEQEAIDCGWIHK